MPIVADVDIGHTSPMITLPLGMNVKLEARTSRPVISIDESATV
jgi:muramoyltetrapeptide carboxypeptidase LdcA involved in peptidoglycan recycling